MSIVSKLKKNELKLVAEKIGLTIPGDAKMIDLKRLIEESDVFKEDYEFVKSVIEQVLEEVKTQKSQLNGEIELERLKLEKVKAELELARFRTNANNSETSLNGGETEASIDFDTLKEPIVSDKMFQTIDRETAAHINIRQSGDWFRSLQLGKECDLYFTSSVLSWMKNEPRNLKTFVANRMVNIQELKELNKWHHVHLEQNTADIISRGLDPEKIQQSDLWWFGPAFLEVPAVNFPRYVDEIHNCEPYQRELKDNQMESMCFLVQNNEIFPIIDRCSSFLKLQGVLAWCVRFKEKNPLQITTGNLTVAELSTALLCLVRKVQSVYFTTEIWCIERGQQLPDSINLLTLSPFLDERKILCVGGRLRHSNLPAEQKDPMLIPNNHLICDLIVKHYRVSYLHTGTEATLANIRTKFWIVNVWQIQSQTCN
ncbi:integrase catalytic domain-containing protein [Trichonephila clavata]|uniref:Integrase catalytic domain-containing protein n=1 Tax=Trichonephila clavata TaxID=2740835 RepID=A0A8X6I205_TRICU|nr:integrase catalytic domain-containing protein [Trichonephila clavata]